MTDVELAEIKARWEDMLSSPSNPVINSAHAAVDIPKLIREVERLRDGLKRIYSFAIENAYLLDFME